MKVYYYIFVLAFFFSSCQKDKIIFVADHFANLETHSLLIRENESDEWTTFSDKIEGFQYKEGYSYQLKVHIKKVKSILSYTLVEVLSKTKTKKENNKTEKEEWIVSKIEGFTNKTEKTPSFSIENGKIQGNTGCNSFGGSIEYVKGTFKVGRLRYTKMLCQDAMEVEKAFSTALRKATNYFVKKGVLSVYNQDKKLLFTAQTKGEKETINKKWYVSSIKGFHNKTKKVPFFTISSTYINGNNGCNQFGGKFKTDKTGLFSISDLRQTEMYCVEYAGLEKAFHKALSTITHYKITEGSLLLFDKSNYVVMSASAKKPVLNVADFKPYVIEYNVFSRNLAMTNKIVEIKNTLEFADSKPRKTKETKKTLSKTELLFFKNQLNKIGVESIKDLKAPSQKYKYDGAAAAIFIVSIKGTLYTSPTFDHGNPPKELKEIIDKIMELRSK